MRCNNYFENKTLIIIDKHSGQQKNAMYMDFNFNFKIWIIFKKNIKLSFPIPPSVN